MNETTVLWPDVRSRSVPRELIGPKAASLWTLRWLGLKVPPCFFVTTTAFRTHLNTNGLRPQIAARLGRTPEAIEEIRRLIAEPPLMGPLREQIAAAYDRLGAAVVAVRSSATAEDLPGHSFAGQYETILGVKSLEECLKAIRKCWASLWTKRASEYRRRNGIDHQQVEMAVIVQQQIEPEAAGVAFSVDPVTGSRSRIVIESCRGLGEALVSGQVQPDRILLRKKNLALIRQNVVAKEPSLYPKSARKLARAVRRLEKHLGSAQDIEWAMRDGILWFLQARPITALPEPRPWEDRQVWTNLNLGEVAPDVMTPMTYSAIASMFEFFAPVFRMTGADVRRHPPGGLVAGRLYFNINVIAATLRPFASPKRLSAMNDIFGGEQNRSFARGQFDLCEEDLPDLGFRWSRYILSWPGLVRDLITHRASKADEFMAGFKARTDALARFNSAEATTEELTRMVTHVLYEHMSACELLYIWSGGVASGVLQKICRNWLRDVDPAVGFRLLAAQGGLADTEAGLDLWRLAALAHEDRQTETALLGDEAWDSLRPRLARTDPGRRFLADWDRFMANHGQHSHSELEFFSPRWAETPDYVLGLLRGYLRSIERVDPLEKQRQLADQRQRLTEQCRHKLRNPIKRCIFNWSLRQAQKWAYLRENSKSEASRLFAGFRRILLELGERLRQLGILAQREDIFFLEVAEVEPVVKGRAHFDVRHRIAQRRAEYQWNKAQTPPPVVVGRYDPQKYAAPQIDANVKVLQGIAVSAGVATGRARVIMRPGDGQHVEPGEILVAPITNPAWTPYLLPAAGVVMDMGGVLSHSAIIAREYGLPAVVNVGPASRIIQTGQTICVDGNRGTVIILDEMQS
ncbi:MAG: PEP-utilizing enzyme [Planctomycetes bacterium]|nr:PEP-utilizing enzyme [Planctomycetota bacterium]